MNQLPIGWTKCTFDDLLEYIQPTKYIVESTEYNDNYKTPVLTAGKSFIKGYTDETSGIFDELPVIIFDDFTTASKFVSFPFKVKSSAMKILSPRSSLVNIKYVFYLMQTIQISIDTHKRYWISEYSKFEIPLPPFLEQFNIVEKIEEILSELDKGVETLRNTHQQLKVYRQSILKRAFEGKLSEDFRKSHNKLSTGSDLLQRIKIAKQKLKTSGKPESKTKPIASLQQSDELFEIPKEWSWARNEDYLFEVKDGTHDSPKYVENGIPFITQKNIREDGLDFTDIQFISEEDHEKFYQRSNVSKGDVIISMIGHNRGMSAIVDSDRIFSIKNVGLFKFMPSLQLNKFSYYYYQSRVGLELVLSKSKGGAQPFIGLTELRNWPVVVCSLEEQNEVVSAIETRLSVAEHLEDTISDCLKEADGLRLSIFKIAFEGKLVDQNKKYEHAQILLEKIKSENKLIFENKIDPDDTIKKSKKMEETLKSIIEVLKTSQNPISSKIVWQSSIHRNDIDAFYAELKQCIDNGQIKETAREGKESFLTLIDSK